MDIIEIVNSHILIIIGIIISKIITFKIGKGVIHHTKEIIIIKMEIDISKQIIKIILITEDTKINRITKIITSKIPT